MQKRFRSEDRLVYELTIGSDTKRCGARDPVRRIRDPSATFGPAEGRPGTEIQAIKFFLTSLRFCNPTWVPSWVSGHYWVPLNPTTYT